MNPIILYTFHDRWRLQRILWAPGAEYEETKKLDRDYNGVYAICNIAQDKSYIGASATVYTRFRHHIRALNIKKHHNKGLQKDWSTLGHKAFLFCVLEKDLHLNFAPYPEYLNPIGQVPYDDCDTLEKKLRARENLWIRDTYDRKLYNTRDAYGRDLKVAKALEYERARKEDKFGLFRYAEQRCQQKASGDTP